jgi:CheY-like chemotaxis protein
VRQLITSSEVIATDTLLFLERDGITAVREIRRMEAAGEIPGQNQIYALTGNARAGQVESAREAGMNDVIVRLWPSRGLHRYLRH